MLKKYCPLLNPKVENLYVEFKKKTGIEGFPCYEHFKSAKNPCIPPDLPKNDLKIMIVGQSPGRNEDLENRVFVGASGQLLNRVILDLGFVRSDFYITNAVKCFIPPRVKPKTQTVRLCSKAILKYEIEKYQPRKIICLGEIAFDGIQYAIIGKKVWTFENGKRVNIKGIDVLAVWHPSFVLSHLHNYPIWLKQIASFLKEKKANVEIKITTNIDEIENAELIALDVETLSVNLFDKNNKILSIAIGVNENKAYVISIWEWNGLRLVRNFVDGEYEEFIEKLKTYLNSKKIIGHNIKFDYLALKNLLGIDILKNIVCDTLVMHHLIKETPPHDLKTLASVYTDLPDYNIDTHQTNWYRHYSTEEICRYNGFDVIATYRLFNIFKEKICKISAKQKQLLQRAKKEIEKYGLTGYYHIQDVKGLLKQQILHLKILTIMEETGMPISKSYLEENERKVLKEIKKIENELNKYVSEKLGNDIVINWKSYIQLREVFHKLGIHSPEKTDKGQESFSESALKKIENMNEITKYIVPKLFEYRTHIKNYTTYFKIPEKCKHKIIEIKGDIIRISPSINITGTETGRLSVKDPPMQNIPRDNLYRNMVVAEDGWSIVSADYSMAELRIMAGYTNCKNMLAGFESGIDFHTYMAKKIFKKEEITSEERTKAKTVNFAIMYLMSAKSLAEEIGTSKEEAQEIINEWFKINWEVKKFINYLLSIYDNTPDGVEVIYQNIFGRMRRVVKYQKGIPEYYHTQSEIVNFYPQSTVADMLSKGLINFVIELKRNELFDKVKILLTIHDAVLLEVKNEYIEGIKKLIEDTMVYPIKFPLVEIKVPIDFTIDKCWRKE